MSERDMLKCLICFVLGFLVARMMRGNGLSVGASKPLCTQGCINLINITNKKLKELQDKHEMDKSTLRGDILDLKYEFEELKNQFLKQ